MQTSDQINGQVDPVVKPFVDMWSDYMTQANNATRSLLSEFEEHANLKSWQRRWSDAVSKSMEAYMRSPGFLQTMKHNTDAAIQTKRQANDVASEVARNLNLPMASDISGLFERLHSVEEQILNRLDGIDKRLQAIEEQSIEK
jgi:hypothetical protein